MRTVNAEPFFTCDTPFEEADIILFGAPFDSTTSNRPGTRFGPAAIRQESYGLEQYSPYQDRHMTEKKILDVGNVDLPIGVSRPMLDTLYEQTKDVLDAGKLPFMLGGEHLVTLGAFEAIVEKYPDVHIIHFDAHTDMREEFFGAELSHATVLRKCYDFVGDGRIFQFGIRSGEKHEFQFAEDGHVFTQKFNFATLNDVIEKLQGKPVYFTVDLDVMDPSVFPGTGTPEPGGVTFMELLQSVILVCQKCNVIGMDVVELSPHYDPSHASSAVAAKVVREALLAL